MLRAINWNGSPLQYDHGNFTYACAESMVMIGQSEEDQLFHLPCPHAATISWPTCTFGERYNPYYALGQRFRLFYPSSGFLPRVASPALRR